MRNEIFKLLIVTMAIHIQSCQTELKDPSFETINIGSKKNKAIEFTELFSSVQYIPLETTNSCLMGGVSQFSEFEGRFFILDQKTKQVFAFNHDGKFLNKIGRQGKGPGEFLYPKQFVINESKSMLYLYDSTQKKIIRYRLDGQFIDEIRVNAYMRAFALDEKDNILLGYVADLPNMKFDTDINSETIKFIKIDQQGKITNHIAGIESTSFRLEFSYIIQKESDKSILFVEPLNESIFNFDGNNISVRYKLNFGNRTAPDRLKRDLNIMEVPKNGKQVKFFEDALANYFLGFYRFLTNKDWLFLSYQHQRRFEYFFYNKSSHESIEISAEQDGWNKFFMPLFMNDNSMYAVAEPEKLVIKMNEAEKLTSSLSALKEGDNPVIVRYKLR